MEALDKFYTSATEASFANYEAGINDSLHLKAYFFQKKSINDEDIYNEE